MSRHEGEHLAMWACLIVIGALALFAASFLMVAELTFNDEVERIACAGTRIECREDNDGP